MKKRKKNLEEEGGKVEKKVRYQSVTNITAWSTGETQKFKVHAGFAVENIEGDSFDMLISSGYRDDESVKKTRISLDFWDVKNLCGALREVRDAYQKKADYIEMALTEED